MANDPTDDPHDDMTTDMRERFFEETGKTPEQESEDSVAMLGRVLVLSGVAFAFGIAYLLYAMNT